MPTGSTLCCDASQLNPEEGGKSWERLGSPSLFDLLLFFPSPTPPPEISGSVRMVQVGYVTTICFSCFLIRCVMVSAAPTFTFPLSEWLELSISIYVGRQSISVPSTLFILQMCFNAFDKAADLDVLNHPVLNFLYYLVRRSENLHIYDFALTI